MKNCVFAELPPRSLSSAKRSGSGSFSRAFDRAVGSNRMQYFVAFGFFAWIVEVVMLESKRVRHVDALMTGDIQSMGAGVMLRRRASAYQDAAFHGLFSDSLREEIHKQLRDIFREAVLAPADEEWLADHLCKIAVKAAQGDVEKVAHIETQTQQVLVHTLQQTLRFVWSGVWRLEGEPRGMNAMIDEVVRVLLEQ